MEEMGISQHFYLMEGLPGVPMIPSAQNYKRPSKGPCQKISIFKPCWFILHLFPSVPIS